MVEIISLTILVLSLAGLVIVIFQKMPVLAGLTKDSSSHFYFQNLLSQIQKKIKNISFLKNFSFEIFLQKLLSKTRIIFLRLENKIANILQKLREDSQKKKFIEDDDYWKKVKISKK